MVGATVTGLLWAAVSGGTEVSLGSLLAGLVGLWAGYLTACLVVSHTKGSGSMARDYGLRIRGLTDVGIGLLAGLASSLLLVRVVYLVLVALGLFDEAAIERLSDPAERLTRLAHGGAIVVLVVFIGVGAPVVEELFFRGLLQRAVVRRAGPVAGVAISSVLFAAAHFQPLQFPALAAFGVVLGVLAHRTGRLGPGIVAHVVFNGLTLAVLFLV